MMGYQENLELYLNLSRKELQGLCKKNNLPANRSHTQLAKSLATFFKKKNVKSSSSKEKSSSLVEVSLCKSFVPDVKPKETANCSEGTSKGVVGIYDKRTISSELEIYRPVSGIRQKDSDDRQHSQSRVQMETNGHMDSQTSEKAYKTANAVCPCTVDNESPEGFGCSNLEAGDVCIRSAVAVNNQEETTVSQLGSECHDGGIINKSQESLELRNYGQKLLNDAATSSGTRNLASVQRRAVGCTETGVVLSGDISTKTIPSFQFFVMSEEGINLSVDLNSSPVEWISSLKDEVCINHKTQPHMSSILPHNKGFSDVGEHKIAQSEIFGTNSQSIGVERSSGCTDSSLTSVVSENYQSEASLPDATVVSSGSSVLTSSSIPVEMSGCLDGNQGVSSTCITHTNAQNHMAFDTVSCPGDMNVLPRESAGAAFIIEKSNASVLDISPKLISNMDNLCHDETINSEPVDCHTKKIANVEASTLGSILTNISKKNNLLKSDETGNSILPSDIGNLGDPSGACRDFTWRGPMEGLSEVSGQVNRSSFCQLGGQLMFDHSGAEVQLDPGSADHHLNQHECSPGSTIAQDLVSASNDELKCLAKKES